MIGALSFAFLLALVALSIMLLMHYSTEFPAMRLWALAQTIRSAIWFTHLWPLITALDLVFPAFQLLVVAEAIWRAGILFPDGKRGGFYAWCWLVGIGMALLAVSQSPPPYPTLSPFAYQLHLALHVLGLMTLLASLSYTAILGHWRDPLGVRTRLAMALYLSASVAADRIHDPALWEAYTVAGTMAQTIAVILLICAFSRFHPGHRYANPGPRSGTQGA